MAVNKHLETPIVDSVVWVEIPCFWVGVYQTTHVSSEVYGLENRKYCRRDGHADHVAPSI
jgi:hypothetical protein